MSEPRSLDWVEEYSPCPHCVSVTDLAGAVDRALYRAKSERGDRFEFGGANKIGGPSASRS